MSIPKVSILIPVYNVSLYIERCAHSIFNQTFQDIEYIFVDDGSPDDSVEKLNTVLLNYPERADSVRIIRHEQNKGISAARQTALDHATGDYVYMMDSDDYVEYNLIEELYNKAISSMSDLVYCLFYVEYGNRTEISGNSFVNNKVQLIDHAINGNSSYWNKLIARSLIVDNDIRTLAGVDYGDDLAVLVKVIYYAQNISFCSKALYHYVQYNADSCTKLFKPKYIEDRLVMVEYLTDFLSSIPDSYAYQQSIWLLKATRKERLLRLMGAQNRFVDLYPDMYPHIHRIKVKLSSKVLLWFAIPRYKDILKRYIKLLNRINRGN